MYEARETKYIQLYKKIAEEHIVYFFLELFIYFFVGFFSWKKILIHQEVICISVNKFQDKGITIND